MNSNTIEQTHTVDLVDLDLGCVYCGGRLTVQFEDWVEDRDPLVKTSYVCPFCQKPFTFEGAGRVVWATPSIRYRLTTH